MGDREEKSGTGPAPRRPTPLLGGPGYSPPQRNYWDPLAGISQNQNQAEVPPVDERPKDKDGHPYAVLELSEEIDYHQLESFFANLVNDPGEYVKIYLNFSGNLRGAMVEAGLGAGLEIFYEKTDTNRYHLGFSGYLKGFVGLNFKLVKVRYTEQISIAMSMFDVGSAGQAAAKLLFLLIDAEKRINTDEEGKSGHHMFQIDTSDIPEEHQGHSGYLITSESHKSALSVHAGGNIGPIKAKGDITGSLEQISKVYKPEKGKAYHVSETHTTASFGASFNLPWPKKKGRDLSIEVEGEVDWSDTKGSPYLYENGVFRNWTVKVGINLSRVIGNNPDEWVEFMCNTMDRIEKIVPDKFPKLKRQVFRAVWNGLDKALSGVMMDKRSSAKGAIQAMLTFNFHEFGEGDAKDVAAYHMMYKRIGLQLSTEASLGMDFEGGVVGGGFEVNLGAENHHVLYEDIGWKTWSYVHRQFLQQEAKSDDIHSYDQPGTSWHDFVKYHKRDILRLVYYTGTKSEDMPQFTGKPEENFYYRSQVAAAIAREPLTTTRENTKRRHIDDLSEDEVDTLLRPGLKALENVWIGENTAHQQLAPVINEISRDLVASGSTTPLVFASPFGGTFGFLPGFAHRTVHRWLFGKSKREQQEEQAGKIYNHFAAFKDKPMLLKLVFDNMGNYSVTLPDLRDTLRGTDYEQPFEDLLTIIDRYETEQEQFRRGVELGIYDAIECGNGRTEYIRVSAEENMRRAKDLLARADSEENEERKQMRRDRAIELLVLADESTADTKLREQIAFDLQANGAHDQAGNIYNDITENVEPLQRANQMGLFELRKAQQLDGDKQGQMAAAQRGLEYVNPVVDTISQPNRSHRWIYNTRGLLLLTLYQATYDASYLQQSKQDLQLSHDLGNRRAAVVIKSVQDSVRHANNNR